MMMIIIEPIVVVSKPDASLSDIPYPGRCREIRRVYEVFWGEINFREMAWCLFKLCENYIKVGRASRKNPSIPDYPGR